MAQHAPQPQPTPSGQPDSGSLRVVNQQPVIDAAHAQVFAAVERHNYPKASVFALKLSLHEALMNAFKHGHKNLPTDTPITLCYAVNDATVTMEIEDQGPGFNPDDVPDPTLEENIERGSGRGLLLIKAYMSSATYNAKGNKLTMVYQRPRA
jgi:serine/threonine-protein kinase RsbW